MSTHEPDLIAAAHAARRVAAHEAMAAATLLAHHGDIPPLNGVRGAVVCARYRGRPCRARTIRAAAGYASNIDTARLSACS